MIQEHLLCWVTLAASIFMIFAIAGPYSNRPLSERLLMWFLSISLMGIAMYWIVYTYDRKMIREAAAMAYYLMLASRVSIIATLCYVFYQWTEPKESPCDTQQQFPYY